MQKKHQLAYWLFGVILLLTFALADAAAVALPAAALTINQLFAGAIAFGLIAGGVLFTVWRLE